MNLNSEMKAEVSGLIYTHKPASEVRHTFSGVLRTYDVQLEANGPLYFTMLRFSQENPKDLQSFRIYI
jgi:hypothetical protein